ncbi:MAG: Rid family detoxifying hydrolase [Flavobacteriaceae bacterium]|tara:strand:+ start:436 stop:822 length:387 start_codon:yes stop_codon:yes gene_type:complete
MKKIIKTEKAPLPVGPYSQAVMIDNTLYISGQVGFNINSNELIITNIEDETDQVMKNIKAILNHVNFNFENVIKSTIFITDMNNFSKVNKVYGKYFDEKSAPARETVEVSALPIGARIEISVIAKKID